MLHPSVQSFLQNCPESQISSTIEIAIQLIESGKKEEAITLVLQVFPPPPNTDSHPDDLTELLTECRLLLDLVGLNPGSPQVGQFLAKRGAVWETAKREDLQAIAAWLQNGMARKDWEWLSEVQAIGRRFPVTYPWSHPVLACWRAKTPTPTLDDLKALAASLQSAA